MHHPTSTKDYLYLLAESLSRVDSIGDLLEVLVVYPQSREASSVVLLSGELNTQLEISKLRVSGQWSASAGDTFATGDPYLEFIRESTEAIADNKPVFLGPSASVDRVASSVLIPLKVDENWIGVVQIFWESPQTFSDEDRQVYAAMGFQASWALYGLMLGKEIQERRKRTELQTQIDTGLSQAANEQEILSTLSSVLAQYQVDVLILSYFDTILQGMPETLTLMARWTSSPELDTAKPVRLGWPRALPEFLGKYLTTPPPDEAILIEDMLSETQGHNPAQLARTGFDSRSAAIIPLFRRGWQGMLVINWENPHLFSEEEKYFYNSLVQILSPIIASRRAYLAQEVAHRESEQRAKELEMVSKVSAAASRNLDFELLLQTVVDLSTSSFNLYHAHVYLLDSTQEHLVLAATSGETGKALKDVGVTRLSMAHDPSIAVRCAQTKDGIIVNDVSRSADYVPNPLLPEVRSEMAVPMLLGDDLVGVFNLQSKEVNHFSSNIMLVMRALADEIAVAVQNVRSFEEQRRAAEELRNLDKLKNQFLATMSHELRTPLNAILNFTYFVSSGLFGPVNPKQVDTLGKVTDSATHLLGLINDILDFSKIDAGMMHLFWEDINLNQILEKTLATANGLPHSGNVELVADIEADLPIIRGDKQRIRQILFNLLSNALKFAERGKVTLSAHRSDEEILLSVSDTGPGIRAEDQQSIFKAFKQTTDGMSKGGTGLGLPITKHLVEAHGGRLWLTSELDVGSTFYVALPLTR